MKEIYTFVNALNINQNIKNGILMTTIAVNIYELKRR